MEDYWVLLKIRYFFEVEAGRKFTPEYLNASEDLNFRPNPNLNKSIGEKSNF